MIKIIGVKRITVLLALLAINAFFALAIYGYVAPENEKSERKVRSLKGQINTVQADIERMQVEFEQLGRQQGRYDELKADDFFKAQGRTMAKDALKRIQDESQVISAVASVRPGMIEDSAEAQKAKHKVLVSPVEISIKAFDDRDIYRYIEVLEKTFPGHVSIDDIQVERVRDVSSAVLRAIITGANPPLLSAKLRLSWRTMIPEEQVISQEEN